MANIWEEAMGDLNLGRSYSITTVPYCLGGYWSVELKNFLTISLPSFWPCFFSISYGFSRPARHSRPRGFKALLRPLLLTLSWSLIFLCTLYSSCFRGLRPLTVWCCGQTASNDGLFNAKNRTAVTNILHYPKQNHWKLLVRHFRQAKG